jgi:hypothetical protein
MKTLWRNLQTKSVFLQGALVMGLEGLIYIALTPFIWRWGSETGFLAAALAAVICLIATFLSLCIHRRFQNPNSILIAVPLEMIVSMGIPLATGLGIHLHGGPLSQAGFIYYLLLFYMLTLALKTALTLPVNKPKTTAHNSENNPA